MDLVIRHLPIQVSVVDEEGTLVYWHGDLFADCELRHVGVHVDESHNEHSRRTIARMELLPSATAAATRPSSGASTRAA